MSTYLDLKNAILKNGQEEYIADDLKFVDDQMDRFRDYFNKVYEHVVGSESTRLMLSAGRIEIEKYQDRIMKLDGNRKHAHNMAIDACNKLNRLCDAYNIDHFCPEVIASTDGKQTMNRGKIADFVGKFMYETYQRGRNKADLEIEAVMKQYDIKYGDRTYLDAAFMVAKDDSRNPGEAYQKKADNQFLVEYNEIGTVNYKQEVFDSFEEAKLFVDNLPDTFSAIVEVIEYNSLEEEFDTDFDIADDL